MKMKDKEMPKVGEVWRNTIMGVGEPVTVTAFGLDYKWNRSPDRVQFRDANGYLDSTPLNVFMEEYEKYSDVPEKETGDLPEEMSCEEYRKRVLELDRGGPSQFEHAVVGLCSEAGEIADLLKKSYTQKEGVDGIDACDALSEGGDALYYLDLYLASKGWTMEQARRTNIAKLQRRRMVGNDPEAERKIFLDEFKKRGCR